jgi:hypothetical protein
MMKTRIQMILSLLALFPASVLAQEGMFYGLLRSRDLTPFGFVRLDMRPAHAVSIEPGGWAFETEVAYQNTWATSPEVERYLTDKESQGRHRLTAQDVKAIRALPGENYLMDMEQALFDVTVHYKFAENWAAYSTFGLVSFNGGFMDSTIEKFHDTFGFSTFGRPAVARNDMNLVYDLKGAQLVYLGEWPTDGGLVDPVLGVRHAGFQFSPQLRLTLEAAVKVPLQGRRQLVSSGRTDYGLQSSLQWLGRRNAFYCSAAAVYFTGARAPVHQESQVIPTLILGYEFKLTQRTNVNLQTYASKSVYSHSTTDQEELIAPKYQYSLGLRHRFQNVLITVGFNENLRNVNNTPDVGFQLGVAYAPF